MKNKIFFLPICATCLLVGCDLERIDENNNGGGTTCPAVKFNTQVGGSDYDKPVEVLATADCSYVICGQSQVDTDGQAILIKVNDKGVQQWERKMGTSAYDYITNFAAIKTGGYMICGGTLNNNPSAYDALVIKTDENGIEAWQRYFNVPGFSTTANSIVEMPDGGFLLACTQNDQSATPVPSQIALIKIDANGTQQWKKNIAKTDYLYVADMVATLDGGFILSGTEIGTVTQKSSTYILKLDSGGNKEWENTYVSPVSTYSPGYGVAALANGYAVAASILGTNDHDLNVLFYDLNGTLKWSKVIGGSSADEAIDIEATTDGQIVVSAYSSSFSATQEVYLLKLNATSGSTIWETHFGQGSGISTFLAPANDGGFIVTGITNNTGNADILLFKRDKDGN